MGEGIRNPPESGSRVLETGWKKKKEQKKSSPSAGSGQFHGAAHLPAESLLFTLSHPGSLAGFFRALLVLHPSTFPIWLLFLTL